MRSPPVNSNVAAKPWTVNFSHGPAEKKSSYTPRRKTKAPAEIIVRTVRPEIAKAPYVNSRAIAKLPRNDEKIATPPSLGKARLCKWRADAGGITQPWRLAVSRTHFVETNEKKSEHRNVARLAISKRSSQKPKGRLGAL